ncbi:hypothetical protein [Lentzea xinjiangensis]|uniref:hypothetical protein n=1 Tax=Lentzea xinjiangensis TaxID=402600 RepID=UPI000B7F9524|nr:hypothetical protein [Lentzea xinjiangensis]
MAVTAAGLPASWFVDLTGGATGEVRAATTPPSPARLYHRAPASGSTGGRGPLDPGHGHVTFG